MHRLVDADKGNREISLLSLGRSYAWGPFVKKNWSPCILKLFKSSSIFWPILQSEIVNIADTGLTAVFEASLVSSLMQTKPGSREALTDCRHENHKPKKL